MNKKSFFSRTLISVAFLFPLLVSSLWVFTEYDLTHHSLSRALNQQDISTTLHQDLSDATIYFDIPTVKPKFDRLQTDAGFCLTNPSEDIEVELSPIQVPIEGQKYIEVETLFTGQGKMYDLFYRYPCRPSVSDGMDFYLGK